MTVFMARRWYAVITLVGVCAAASCGAAEGGAAGAEDGPERLEHEITMWTDAFELFVEFPAPVAGTEGAWAVHFTELDSFRAVTSGIVTVRFDGVNGTEHRFVSETPAAPGLYILEPVFPNAGDYDVVIELDTGAASGRFELAGVEVFAASTDVPYMDGDDDPDEIGFSKERQWEIPFASVAAAERTVSEAIRVAGEVMAAPGLRAEVASPVSGLVLADANRASPPPGAWVERGQVLAVLAPLEGEASFSAHRARLERLERELERAERLLAVDAIPARRVEETRHDLEVTRASLEAMGAADADGYHYRVRAPISGAVQDTWLAPGARVQAGQTLFTLVDHRRVWLRLRVPASAAAAAGQAESATFTVDGDSRRYRAERVVSVGSVVDPQSRTIPVHLEVANPVGELKIGSLAQAHLLVPQASGGVVVPNGAIRNEDGRTVAYVQTGGESFARRVLRLGTTDGEWTVVTDGIQPGERVVTLGAFQVRLASMGDAEIADHGHPH